MTTNLKICTEKILNRDYNYKKKINEDDTLKASFYTEKKWKEGDTITIGFFGYRNPNLRFTPLTYINKYPHDPIEQEIVNLKPQDAVKKVVLERIQPIVNLNLQFINDVLKANIRISFEDDGAWSYIGKDALYQPTEEATMNFGWLDSATIIHEFCHALGMVHEHQNPRGKTIPWNKEAVYEWARKTQGWDEQVTDINILDHYSLDITNGSYFDPKSIMLYFFPKTLTTDGKGTEQNFKISPLDVIWLNKNYPNSYLTPIEYYKRIFNEDITNIYNIENNNTFVNSTGINSSGTEEKSNDFLKSYGFIIICLIVILVLVFLLIKCIRKNRIKENNNNGEMTNRFISNNDDDYNFNNSNDDKLQFASFIALLK